jgi:hypothetical protein
MTSPEQAPISLPPPSGSYTTLPETQTPRKPLSLRRKIVYAMLTVLWFFVLMIPCFLIGLAVQREIIVPTGSLPGQEVRIWLIMEERQRGIGISSGSASMINDSTAQLQTSSNFVLWAGRGTPSTYCEIFTRDSADARWMYSDMRDGAC